MSKSSVKRKRGRPKLPAREKKGAYVPVLLEAEDLDAMDQARGEQKRSAWIRDAVRRKLGRPDF